MHPRHARAGENRSRVENRSRAEDEGQYEYDSVHSWVENKTPQVKSSQVCFLCIDLT